VNLLFGAKYTDLCYGYNAFWRDCLTSLNLDSTGFEIETQLNLRAVKVGLVIQEVPSMERDRIHGESNLHPVRDGLRVLRTIMRERFSRLHAPGPAWAALTGQLHFEEEVEAIVAGDVAVVGGEVAMPRLLEGPADA
jgi:hypothetical protein